LITGIIQYNLKKVHSEQNELNSSVSSFALYTASAVQLNYKQRFQFSTFLSLDTVHASELQNGTLKNTQPSSYYYLIYAMFLALIKLMGKWKSAINKTATYFLSRATAQNKQAAAKDPV